MAEYMNMWKKEELINYSKELEKENQELRKVVKQIKDLLYNLMLIPNRRLQKNKFKQKNDKSKKD